MLSSFLSCWLPGCTPPPPPQQLRRWQLVRLPIHSSSRPKLSPGQEEAAPFRTGSLLEQPGSRSGAVSEDEGFVAVPERLTSSFSLFLINLKWHRTIINTISQAELLALCRLAKARSTIRCTEQLGPLSAAPPSKGVLMQQEWRGPCSTDSGAHCAGDRETPCSADGVSASPSHAWRDPQSERPVTASGIPLIRIVGRRKLRVDPIDVCGLLVSGCLQLADLPLLEDLEAVAEETEAAHEKENKCWKWAPLLGMGRRRGDIWKCAAANLQHQQQQKQRQQQRQGPVRRRRNKRFASEGLSSSLTVLQSPRSTAAANDLNVKTPPPPAEGASAEGTAADRPFSSTGAQLGFCGHPACTAEVSGRAPSGDPLKIHFPCGRKGATRIPLGVPDTPSALVCSEDGGEEAEITGEAAAAAVSNLSNNSLALLGHSCRWPLAGACDGWASPSCTAHMGLWEHLPGSDSPSAPVGAYPGDLPSHSEEDWKSAVGFRESRRGGSISRKRRETQRQRQRLSPLDPPYDSHALLLHPFSAAPAAALPDSETARAHEVHEVSLDFLSRTKPTQGCPKCSRRRGSKGDASEGPLTVKVPPCPLHQRLHYTQVGKGPERVVLIHGICMSGYFFAEVIRVLFPDTGEGGLPRGNRPEGPDDGDERGRYSFFCVDLLGYGKSASIPSTQNYSRREQAEAIMRDLILANGFTSVHLVGHSFGGLVAAELCEMLPAGFVKALVLLSPAYFESERQALRILTASHFPAAHTVAHPYFGELLLRLGVVLRPLFEPLVLRLVPPGELPQLSVADIFSIHPDALTGTIRSIVQDRIDMTLQLLRQRGQRASLFHGTADGVIPIRQARFLALRYPNIHLRALPGFVHHFPASHAQFTAHIILQEIRRCLNNGRGLCYSHDEDPSNLLVLSNALLLPGHPTWH